MSWVRAIVPWLDRSDVRSAAQVERDIDDEIAFHIEMRARDLVEAGMSQSDAQREAESRFGDVRTVRTHCKEVQMTERILVQKIQAVLIAVLFTALVGVGWQSWMARQRSMSELARMQAEVANLNAALHAKRDGSGLIANHLAMDDEIAKRLVIDDEMRRDLYDAVWQVKNGKGSIGRLHQPGTTNDEWLARFRTAKSWRDGLAIGDEIAKLPDEEALTVMRAIYHQIPTVECRQQVLKAFVFDGAKPYACDILDLAATDTDLAVQGWAFTYLQQIALVDFSQDYPAYQAWRARTAGKPMGAILYSSAYEFLQRAQNESGEALLADLNMFSRFDERAAKKHAPELAESMARRGSLDLAARWLASDDPRLVDKALAFAARAGADEAFVTGRIQPLLATGSTASDAVQATAVRAVVAARGTKAVPDLLDFLQRSLGDLDAHGIAANSVSTALADVHDATALPRLIAILVDNDRREVRRVLGSPALHELTGVSLDDAHDGAFWLKWWSENQDRLPPEVRGQPIPFKKAR